MVVDRIDLQKSVGLFKLLPLGCLVFEGYYGSPASWHRRRRPSVDDSLADILSAIKAYRNREDGACCALPVHGRFAHRCLAPQRRPPGLDLADNHSNLADLRARLRAQIVEPDAMQTILERAIDRGEIAAIRLTPRIVSLPTDLARHEILMTFEPLSDDAIKEIVDEIFLPLVSPTDQRI
jgi:hypothetical protein